jgi:hypothetical protein
VGAFVLAILIALPPKRVKIDARVDAPKRSLFS